MTTKLVFTIHTITSQKQRHAANRVVEIAAADFADFEALGAVRTPTEDELSLYGLGQPKSEGTVEPTPVATTPTERDALESEANALGVKFQKNTSDNKLRERIAEAKAAPTGDVAPQVAPATTEAETEANDTFEDLG